MTHHGLLYDGSDDLYARVLTALTEAREAELVVLACQPHHSQTLQKAVADTLPHLEPPLIQPRPEIHSRPAVVLAAQRRLVEKQRRRVWYINEPDHGTTPDCWTRAACYEAACTISLARYPLSTICAYPATGTPGTVIGAVAQAHPRLITATGTTANPTFCEPAALMTTLAPHDPVPEPSRPPELHLTGASTLHDIHPVRHRLTTALAGLPTLIRTDFVAAVNEALTNAVLHGAPPITVTLWIAREQVECRVTDSGPGFTDPFAGYLSEPDADRTRTGLWLARQACDDLTMWHAAGRFTVRLATTTAPERVLRTHGAVARAEAARARVNHTHRRIGSR
ncbi:hypothetical protein GCM10010168_72520 [Actinoplanes ianthinogenes]|uniref:Anti-sigma regulatory factor (Ser/Thr protein kinase) n=1 Tax=Actinoplanes ianthinogenes TaxID=122358 RepID=A0ABM7M6B6_9ACTN|nr:ATP-binding protein [Actinoplanes ianthinogenes]BCJ47159.1 hypothetical protein Aiant_78160 [Actinoplanes ianthinogenes]GGR42990.1 hypothetical protein GCM10010168_72520 [Actinoplanes ianthinogenes]